MSVANIEVLLYTAFREGDTAEGEVECAAMSIRWLVR